MNEDIDFIEEYPLRAETVNAVEHQDERLRSLSSRNAFPPVNAALKRNSQKQLTSFFSKPSTEKTTGNVINEDYEIQSNMIVNTEEEIDLLRDVESFSDTSKETSTNTVENVDRATLVENETTLQKGKRKAPMERKPLGNISNYKQHCRSDGNSVRKEKSIKQAKQTHQITQESIPVTLNKGKFVAAVGQNHMNPIELNNEREETLQLDFDTASLESIPITLKEDITAVGAGGKIYIETLSLETNEEKEISVQLDCEKIQLPAPSWKREQVLNMECVHYFEVIVNETASQFKKRQQ
ncbi:hypothetical protein OUZ56_016763 [Daphnia magna]|uniref:Uncharacterized protein n=1 Tax=Daphnia magna TaxID=35525 RepID=A0ABR0ARL7_9CRUS|nr:hypothetical protein OUZ56_016763 [Daphnia magna]